MQSLQSLIRFEPDGHGEMAQCANGDFVLLDDVLSALSTPPAPEAVGEALGYATRLAEAIHAKHFAEVTQWRPLPDLLGVLTQINNMTSGLSRATQEGAEPVGFFHRNEHGLLYQVADAYARDRRFQGWWLYTRAQEPAPQGDAEDAARYRWLRDHWVEVHACPARGGMTGVRVLCEDDDGIGEGGERLDAAIDAARRAIVRAAASLTQEPGPQGDKTPEMIRFQNDLDAGDDE